MIITDNLLNNLIRHLKSARMGGERATVLYALEATLASIPLDEVTRDRCAQIADARVQSSKTQKVANELYREQNGLDSSVEQDAFCDHAISVATGIASAIRALPATGLPLDAVTRDRCKEAVWGLYAAPQVNPHDDAKDGWQQGCEAAVAAIGALPVVPPRLMPTREAVARAMCCPNGCRYSASDCLESRFQHQATAILALFEQDTP